MIIYFYKKDDDDNDEPDENEKRLLCQDMVDLMMKVPTHRFRATVERAMELFRQESTVSVFEPEKVVERRGRPSLKALSSTQREPSQFEVVEKEIKDVQKEISKSQPVVRISSFYD